MVCLRFFEKLLGISPFSKIIFRIFTNISNLRATDFIYIDLSITEYFNSSVYLDTAKTWKVHFQQNLFEVVTLVQLPDM